MRIDDQINLGLRLLPWLDRTTPMQSAATLRAAATRAAARDAELGRWMLGILASDGGAASLVFAASWALSAFPQITVGHKLAASLMATRLPREAVGEIALPWHAFVVVVPDGLIAVPDKATLIHQVDYLLVVEEQDAVTISLRSRDADFVLVKRAPSLAATLAGDDSEVLLPDAAALDDVHARALDLAGRLVIGASLEMTDPARFRPPTAGKRSTPSSQTDADRALQTYVLTRKVVLDCRDAVRGHLAGHRSGLPAVQTLVRGHWKRQAHGVGRSERRWLHVEPYWRGPEDAPIAVREHELRSRS